MGLDCGDLENVHFINGNGTFTGRYIRKSDKKEFTLSGTTDINFESAEYLRCAENPDSRRIFMGLVVCVEIVTNGTKPITHEGPCTLYLTKDEECWCGITC